MVIYKLASKWRMDRHIYYLISAMWTNAASIGELIKCNFHFVILYGHRSKISHDIVRVMIDE